MRRTKHGSGTVRRHQVAQRRRTRGCGLAGREAGSCAQRRSGRRAPSRSQCRSREARGRTLRNRAAGNGPEKREKTLIANSTNTGRQLDREATRLWCGPNDCDGNRFGIRVTQDCLLTRETGKNACPRADVIVRCVHRLTPSQDRNVLCPRSCILPNNRGDRRSLQSTKK
jgi:hypothetical protein